MHRLSFTSTQWDAMTKLQSRADVARRMGVKPHTLAVWALKGFGPPVVKIGSRAMYDEADIEKFIESRKRASTSAVFPGTEREEAAA